MTDVATIREQIDRRIRPGQKQVATATTRTPQPAVIGSSQTTVANRYNWQESENYQYGCYGRNRYGTARYLDVN